MGIYSSNIPPGNRKKKITPKSSGKIDEKWDLLNEAMNDFAKYAYAPNLKIPPNAKISPGQILTPNQNFVNAPSNTPNYIPNPSGQGLYEAMKKMEYEKRNKPILVVFFGFNGLLAQKYAVVKDMSEEEVRARLAFSGDKVPWKIERVYEGERSDFSAMIDMFEGTPNQLTKIEFDDAMNIIRIGLTPTQMDDFDEPEEDEFDDNCLETCQPGNHKCGKK